MYDRSIYSKLVSILNKSGTDLILFDIYFPEFYNNPNDTLLIESLKEKKTVYLPVIPQISEENELYSASYVKDEATALTKDEELVIKENLWHPQILESGNPYKAENILTTFYQLTQTAKGIGHIQVSPDNDGVYRRVPLLYKYLDGYIPGISFRMVCDYLKIDHRKIAVYFGNKIILRDAILPSGIKKDIIIPIDNEGRIIINYAGKWNNSFTHYSIDSLYQAQKKNEIGLLSEELNETMAIISDITTRGKDYGTIPFEKIYPLSGIHSNIINSILTDNFIKKIPIPLLIFLEIITAFTLWLFAIKLKPIPFSIFSLLFFLFMLIFNITLFIFLNFQSYSLTISLSYLLSLFLMVIYKLLLKERENIIIKSSEKSRKDFISYIAHEIRTPLTLILSPLSAITEGEYGKSIDYNLPVLKSIKRNAERLLRLSSNFLDYSKYEDIQSKVMEKESVNISELLNTALLSITYTAKSLNIKIENNIMENIYCFCDKEAIEKVIYNLLSNAIKYTPQGKDIFIELKCDENIIILRVKDSGIGIPDNKQSLIFEKFIKVGKPVHSIFESSGIGLYLTKEILKLHNGEIKVTSKEGEGSEFIVILPKLTNILSSINETENKEPFKRNKSIENNSLLYRVLILEDNTDMADYLENILTSHYMIKKSKNGKEALDMLTYFSPNLIISDIMMPEMDGFEFISKIKKDDKFKDIPCLFLSAKSDDDARKKAFEYNAVDFIQKPFYEFELLSKIKIHIEYNKVKDKIKKQGYETSENIIIEINNKMEMSYINRRGNETFENPKTFLELMENEEKKEIFMKKCKEIKEKKSLLFFFRFRKSESLFLCNGEILKNDEHEINGYRFFIINVKEHIFNSILTNEEFIKRYDISEREKEVIDQLILGYLNKEIADRLYISTNTVKTHIKNIYRKIGISSREELFAKIGENGNPTHNDDSIYFTLLKEMVTQE